MSARLEVRVRWLLRTLALLIATLAVLVARRLLALDGVGAAMGTEEAAAAAVGAGMLAFAAVVAAAAAQAPRRRAYLMPLLALGALLCGASLLWLAPGHGRLVAAAAVVALAPLCAWCALWLDEEPSEATAQRDAELVSALVSTAIPEAGPAAGAAPAERLAERATAALLARAARGRAELRALLRALDVASRVAWRRGFARIERGQRTALLDRLARAPGASLRRRVLAVRAALLEAVYADPDVERAIGFDRARLHARLALGPNRDAHAARLEAAPGTPPAIGPVPAELVRARALAAAALPREARAAKRDDGGSALPRRSLIGRLASAGAALVRRGSAPPTPAGDGPVRP